MLELLLLGLGRQVGRPEGHRLETIWHLGVACSDRDVLQEVLELLGEGDTCEAATHT